MKFHDEHAHLVLLAVRPAHQRSGTARRLIDWLVESAALPAWRMLRMLRSTAP
jgi:ribosomal protein S18 acetylase RimI-like enzyme